MKRPRAPRFGLLELLLLTGAIAAWIPTYRARQAIPPLTASIDRMKRQSSELQIIDKKQLCIRSVPSAWTAVQSWKYYLPKNADVELRFATEAIQNVTYPVDYQTAALPAGVHSLSLKYTSDQNGYLTELYLDDSLVLTESKPKEWINASGYSSQGGPGSVSSAHPLDEPLTLRRMRYSYRHPTKKWSSFSYPETYACKGSYLWIAPRSLESATPPAFVSPPAMSGNVFWGHREGTRVTTSNYGNPRGMIKILPSYFAVRGEDGYSWRAKPTLLSVRPIVEGSASAEIPEQLVSNVRSGVNGLSYAVRESIDAPEDMRDVSRSFKSTGAFSDDGKTMRIFLHYEPFPSGARPIVELIFDTDRPDAIGFLVHQAPGSTPIKACQLVTKKDADYQWQAFRSQPNQSESTTAESTLLPNLYPKLPSKEPEKTKPKKTTAGTSELPWKSIPIETLPREPSTDGTETRRLQFQTTINDFSSVLYAPGVPFEWKYKGVPNNQTWILPVANRADDRVTTVEVKGTRVFPGTQIAIADGMVLQNVRVTIPVTSREPVWLSYAPE